MGQRSLFDFISLGLGGLSERDSYINASNALTVSCLVGFKLILLGLTDSTVVIRL